MKFDLLLTNSFQFLLLGNTLSAVRIRYSRKRNRKLPLPGVVKWYCVGEATYYMGRSRRFLLELNPSPAHFLELDGSDRDLVLGGHAKWRSNAHFSLLNNTYLDVTSTPLGLTGSTLNSVVCSDHSYDRHELATSSTCDLFRQI